MEKKSKFTLNDFHLSYEVHQLVKFFYIISFAWNVNKWHDRTSILNITANLMGLVVDKHKCKLDGFSCWHASNASCTWNILQIMLCSVFSRTCFELNSDNDRSICKEQYKGYIKATNLLPATSTNLIATAMQGSISKVVNALIRKDEDSEPIPKLERRTSTPACSRICGV